MPELASLVLCIGKLRISADMSWGATDDDREPMAFGLAPVEVPELEDDDTEDRLGFRA